MGSPRSFRHARSLVLAVAVLLLLPATIGADGPGWLLLAPPKDREVVEALEAAAFKGPLVPSNPWTTRLSKGAVSKLADGMARATDLPEAERIALMFGLAWNDAAPLHEWEQVRAFDTARECEAVRTDVVRTLGERARPLVSRGSPFSVDELNTLQGDARARFTRCVPASRLRP